MSHNEYDDIYNGPKRQGPTQVNKDGVPPLFNEKWSQRRVNRAIDRWLKDRGLPVGKECFKGYNFRNKTA